MLCVVAIVADDCNITAVDSMAGKLEAELYASLLSDCRSDMTVCLSPVVECVQLVVVV